MGDATARGMAAAVYAERVGSAAFTVATPLGRLAEVGNIRERLGTQSVRKVVASTVVGSLVRDGRLGLQATLADLEIDDSVPPSLSDEERTATVQHLLQSRSGITHPAAFEDSAMRARPARGAARPGEGWHYNNWDFNVLATVVERTGLGFFDAVRDEIAVPCDWAQFQVTDCEFVLEPVSEHPAYHFALTAEEFEALGLCYLTGSAPVSESWVAESWHPWTPSTGNGFGFGYCWWLGDPARLGGLRSFLAMGGRGHAIVVIPEAELVVTHRVEPRSPIGWEDFWPALSLAVGTTDLDTVLESRRERLADLAELRRFVPMLDVGRLELNGAATVALQETGPAGGPRVAIVQPAGAGRLQAVLDTSSLIGRPLRLRGEVISTMGTATLFVEDQHGVDAVSAIVRTGRVTLGVRWDENEVEVVCGELSVDCGP